MYHLHLHSVLTSQFCEELIANALGRGFEAAKVNSFGEQKQMTSVRNNERLEWDDSALARQLERNLLLAAADNFPFIVEGQVYAKAGEHLRMYRYRPGQYFKPHRDGHFRAGGLESHVTVLFYLNDADEGETILMPTSYHYKDDWIRVAPRAGDVLMFHHDFWHEGRPVASGEKYVLRTDLFYRVARSEDGA